VQPKELRIPMHSGSSDAIHHLDLGRIVACGKDWIILWTFSVVGAEAELRPPHLRLKIRPG
jgi:hypothetical protein